MNMKRKKKKDRIEQLRQDPDFRALVDLLKRQTPDRVDAFVDGLEGTDEHRETGLAEANQRTVQ